MMHMRASFKAGAGVFLLSAMAAFGAHGHSGHGAAEGHGSHGGSGHVMATFPDATTAAAPEHVSARGCWIRALPNRLPAAAYFSLQNGGAQPVALMGAEAEGFNSVMLHTHRTINGMSSMVHVDRVLVKPGERFDFAPGGHHVMLQKPSIDLEVGAKHTITLWFEGDRALNVECDVRPAGASSTGEGG